MVDLMDAEALPERLHPRFDQRVFTAAERDRIAAGGHPHQTRWAIWAAKESCFKLARKLDSNARFSPIAFGVKLNPDGTGTVRRQDRSYAVAIIESADCVYAIAVCFAGDNSSLRPPDIRSDLAPGAGCQSWRVRGGAAPGSLVYSATRCLDAEAERDGGLAARSLARQAIGEVAGVDPQELEISAERGIPRVLYKGARLPVDLSLSHHGRFVAAAFSYPTAAFSYPINLNPSD